MENTTLPEKIFPVNYAGFWDFSIDGLYGDSVINEMDYPNAEQIATEMAKRYNNFPELFGALKALSESNPNDSTFNYPSAIEAARKVIENLKP